MRRLLNIFHKKEEDDTNYADLRIEKVEDNPVKAFRNFHYLDELVNGEGGEVKLECDIIIDSSEASSYSDGIEITKNIVIDGDNHVIDAANLTPIFSLESEEVVIKNLTFKNSKSSALESYNSRVTLRNCTFLDNDGEDGAAIYAVGDSSWAVIDCDFKHNSSRIGGAVYANHCKGMIFRRCNFIDNSVKSMHYEEGQTSYTDKYVERTSGQGGAIICITSDITLEKCVFDNNHADISGGALFLYHYEEFLEKPCAKIFDCTFTRNSAHKKGAAIYNKAHSYMNKCIFEDNRVTDNQLISRLSYGEYNINYGYDDRNTGGALFSFRKMTMVDSRFINNTADYGGAVSNYHEMHVKGCEFTGNNAGSDGGALFNARSKKSTFTLNVEDSTFTDNTAENRGQSVFNEEGSNKLLFTGTTFRNNPDMIQHSLLYNENDMNILKSTFMGVNNCDYIIFQSNNMSSFLNIENSVFEGNVPLNELIHIDDGYSSIKYSQFKGNESYCLIYNEGITTLDKLSINQYSLISRRSSYMGQDRHSKLIVNRNILKFTNREFYEEIKSMLNSGEKDKIIIKKSVGDFYGFTYLQDEIHKSGGKYFLKTIFSWMRMNSYSLKAA